jgi:hypothetical protein
MPRLLTVFVGTFIGVTALIWILKLAVHAAVIGAVLLLLKLIF